MNDIKKIFSEKFTEDKIIFNEPMYKHTSFKIGGNADIFIQPTLKEEIKFIIEKCHKTNTPFYIIGNGSNLLVTDKGYRGVIVQIYKNYSGIEVNKNILNAKSGTLLSAIASTALKNSLSGIEFASGIPGTLGGAVCMNAGAYGREMKDIISSIDVYCKGQFMTITNREAEFEYRNSKILKENMIVLGSEVKLENGIYDDIKSKMYQLNKQRAEKQPVELPSAGSTFKRPKGYFAGKLIMDAGLRGFAIGGAAVSEKHCGFIVNKANASSKDVLNLIDYIKDIVYNKFNVILEPEIRIIGER